MHTLTQIRSILCVYVSIYISFKVVKTTMQCRINDTIFFSCGATALLGCMPPHGEQYRYAYTDKPHSVGFSVRGTGPSQRPLPDNTQYT